MSPKKTTTRICAVGSLESSDQTKTWFERERDISSTIQQSKSTTRFFVFAGSEKGTSLHESQYRAMVTKENVRGLSGTG